MVWFEIHQLNKIIVGCILSSLKSGLDRLDPGLIGSSQAGAGVPFQNIKGRAMFVWWSWDPRGGVGLDRIFVGVMGPPKLPPGASASLQEGLTRCLQNPPPLSETTPSAPKP